MTCISLQIPEVSCTQTKNEYCYERAVKKTKTAPVAMCNTELQDQPRCSKVELQLPSEKCQKEVSYHNLF